jgi:hypothetical protein
VGRAGVESLLYLLNQAFAANREHSLLSNLKATSAEDWLWLPPGGDRSIRDIVQHVGGCKFVYHDHAFAAGTLFWADPLVDGRGRLDSLEDAIAWLNEGHHRLIDSISALDDEELVRPRKANWGESYETRWLISVMIEHDLYHAGEVNHLRSLRSRDDRWAYLRS